MFNDNEIFCDVLVVGGGISGIATSYICAKNGLKTILIEENCYLGGLITGGLVIPSMKTESKGINQEFYTDLIKYSKDFNSQITYGDGNEGWFNPITLKIIFDKMLSDVNCKIIFEAKPVSFEKWNKNIKCVKILSNNLSLPIYSRYYVDATGNGSFSKLLNCEFLSDAKEKQASSLRFIVSGVNLKELSDFLLNIDGNRDVTSSYLINGQIHLSTACTNNGEWALRNLFKKAVNDGVLDKKDADYFQIFTVAGMNDSVAFNCPRLKMIDDNNIYSKSEAIIEGRRAILRLHDFCKKYLKGFSDSYITNIANIIGERESGRVKTKYIYSIEDIKKAKRFSSEVLCSNYPVDIHSDKDGGSILEKNGEYYLPIESLMSYDYENLYVIGKCLGAEFKAQAALRIQQSCASMGEGVARHIIDALMRR